VIAEVEVVKLSGDHRHTLHLGSVELKPFREPRVAIVAGVRIGGLTVSVGTGHFAADPTARHAQLSRTAELLVTRPRPRLLLGDFNVEWAQATEWLAPYGLVPAPPREPGGRIDIDHVAVDGVTIESVELRWLPISDHPAKVVEVTVPG
jgi:endonuclease/exonuclease/phosphatase family metal-dependent hydrolase